LIVYVVVIVNLLVNYHHDSSTNSSYDYQQIEPPRSSRLFDSLEEVEITMMKVIVKVMIMHVVLPEVEEIVIRKGVSIVTLLKIIPET